VNIFYEYIYTTQNYMLGHQELTEKRLLVKGNAPWNIYCCIRTWSAL